MILSSALVQLSQGDNNSKFRQHVTIKPVLPELQEEV